MPSPEISVPLAHQVGVDVNTPASVTLLTVPPGVGGCVITTIKDLNASVSFVGSPNNISFGSSPAGTDWKTSDAVAIDVNSFGTFLPNGSAPIYPAGTVFIAKVTGTGAVGTCDLTVYGYYL